MYVEFDTSVTCLPWLTLVACQLIFLSVSKKSVDTVSYSYAIKCDAVLFPLWYELYVSIHDNAISIFKSTSS